jgi:hypothetical protein
MREGPAPDRFLVGLAALSLLAATAEDQPLACLVDDAQWLDRATVQCLAFAARRLLADPVAMILAARAVALGGSARAGPSAGTRGLRSPMRSVVCGRAGFGCGWICPCEGIGAAQCVGQPVPAGHPPDQFRRVGGGHPGRGDEQRAHRGSAYDRDRVGSGAERGLGHSDHRDAELGVRTRTQAGPAAGIQIGIAIDHQQAHPAYIV